MTSWNSGYISEIGYTHGFYRELSPSLLGFVALASGHCAPAPGRPIAYCELGCGQGFTANLLAAANPDVQVHAVDFNPAHIAGARALAEEAGTPNVAFHDLSFGEFLARPESPEFDIVALHGIWSWVGAERRREIVELLRRRLRPGGLVFVSYNAMPGWAGWAPVRQLMHMHARAHGGPKIGRIGPAIDFVGALEAAGAGFFRTNAVVMKRFEKLKTLDRNYLTHEFLNDVWELPYFADVAAELAEAKLSFVGSTAMLDHIDQLNLTDEQRALLDGVADPVLRETVRDYMVDRMFRRDVFAKGAVMHTAPSSHAAWAALRLALVTPRDQVPMDVTTELGRSELREDIYEPLLDALAEGPATVAALWEKRPEVAAVGWAQLREAISVMIGAGHVEPCPPAEGEALRAERTRAFNAAVMRRAAGSSDLLFLASPVTGSGVPLDRLSQMFLAAEAEGRDPVAHVAAILDGQGERLLRDGAPLTSPEETAIELSRRLDALAPGREVLRRLGVL